jgi:hypothetical protein
MDGDRGPQEYTAIASRWLAEDGTCNFCFPVPGMNLNLIYRRTYCILVLIRYI